MHISGLLNGDSKVDIEKSKVDIEQSKVDIKDKLVQCNKNLWEKLWII